MGRLKKHTLFLFSSILCLYSHSQTLDWVKVATGNSSQVGTAIVIDDDGNVYSTGVFNDTVDFDPNAGVTNLNSNGQIDIFIQKLDNAGNLVWVKQIGSEHSERVLAMDIDTDGNIYITGTFNSDTVDFDPNAGIFNIANLDSKMLYVLKLDADGNFIWAKAMGGTGDYGNESREIVLNDDNLYIAGTYSGTVDFDPNIGIQNHTSPTSYFNYFVLNLSLDGDFIWVNACESSAESEIIAMDLNDAGNIIVTGSYEGEIDLDPGDDVLLFSAFIHSNTFIQKLDSDGTLEWVKAFGGFTFVAPFDLKIDHLGNTYLTGKFNGTADLDPGPEELLITSVSFGDVYMLKLNEVGDLVWVRTFGSDESHQIINAIYIDSLANIYSLGQFFSFDQVNFDPGPEVHELLSNGGWDIFITKWNADGDFIWGNSIGGTSHDLGYGIVLDSDSTIYFNGTYGHTMDFDFGVDSLIIEGDDDFFVEKLIPCPITKDTLNIETCDTYTWIDDFTYLVDTSLTYLSVSGYGCDSLLTLNLVVNYSDLDSLIYAACDSYTWIDGNTYMTDTVTTFVLTNAQGCDSTLVLDLIVNTSDTITEIVNTCDSYTWIDGNTYFSDTLTSHTLTNTSGCDSLIYLNLSLNYSNDTSEFIRTCDSLLWIDGNTYTSDTNIVYTTTNIHGCDSTINLTLRLEYSDYTIDSVVACNSFLWINDINYTNDTLTNDTLTSLSGCDSIVTLDLTVIHVNSEVTVEDPVISANTLGADYQWLNCNEGYAAIPGEVYETFTPLENGSYALLMTLDGCSDTSDCVEINTLSLNDSWKSSTISIYPNPSSGTFNIGMGELKSIEITVHNMRGQLVYRADDIIEPNYHFELNQSPGIYLLSVESMDKTNFYKLILQN